MSPDDPSHIKVLLAYNAVTPDGDPHDLDTISELAVQDEVYACQKALLNCGYQVQLLPCQTIPQILATIDAYQPQVIFNLCEGFRHQSRLEAPLAGLWELLDLPYTGNAFQTLSLAQDKVLTKKLLTAEGIPTPEFQVLTGRTEQCNLSFPVIAKPSREDGSVGITQQSVAFTAAHLENMVARLIAKYRQPILVEKFIAGREFNISLLGNDPVQVLPISELSYAKVSPEFQPIASYEAKWLNEHPLYKMTPPICPAEIEPDLQARLSAVALQVYHALGGRDYGRVDVRLDAEGAIFVLEYNPNPDISPDAGFVRALQAAGWSYERLVDFLVKTAIERKECD